MSLIPSYKPSTEAELREFLFTIGATEDTLDASLKAYDAMAQEIIDRGGVRVIGVRILQYFHPPHLVSRNIQRTLGQASGR